MGKGKRGGGLTGIAKFLNQTEPTPTPTPTPSASTSNLAVPTASTSTNDADGNDNPPMKRRKLEGGTEEAVHATGSTAPESGVSKSESWIKNYDASGLVPHYTTVDQVPEHLQKYFHQRYRYFSLYSESPGCLLDEEGWYSVTPELIANQIAERCRCGTVLDAFCGVGGNAIAFAQTCERVIALDTSPTRLSLARHNAQIYGVADRIEFILADYISFAKAYISQRKASPPSSSNSNSNSGRVIDVVFLSPPWGGPSYLSGLADDPSSSSSNVPQKNDPQTNAKTPLGLDEQHPGYSLTSIQPIPGDELFYLTRQITQNVAYYLPRNTHLQEISDLLVNEPSSSMSSTEAKKKSSGKGEKVEVEEEWMGNKLKAITCYFGGLAEGQEYLFDSKSS